MVVTNADGGPGLSGGATVNARGEVIGTMTAGYPADGSASLDHVSFTSSEYLSRGRIGR
jgi:S1-C subfamily serine protease